MLEFDLSRYNLIVEKGGSMEIVREYVGPSQCRKEFLTQPLTAWAPKECEWRSIVQLGVQWPLAKGSADF